MTRVAVCSRSFSRHPVLRAELLERFPECTFNDDGHSLSGNTLIDYMRDHDRTIIGLESIDEALLAAVPEIRVIAKYGVGLDKIDQRAMARHGVALGWTGGVNRRSVAELTVGFMIALTHRIPEASTLVRDGGWRQIIGHQLSNRTVGIVGCGHIGKDVVRLLQPFGCRVLAHDIAQFPAFYAETGAKPVDLDTLLAGSDVVTLHLPLDDTTRGLMNARRLDQMARGAMLINTARNDIVDEAALEAMLRDGRLAGAAFDVFANEPPETQSLLALPNFLATPHIGGSTEEAILAMGRAAIDGLEHSQVPSFGDLKGP